MAGIGGRVDPSCPCGEIFVKGGTPVKLTKKKELRPIRGFNGILEKKKISLLKERLVTL